MTDMSPAAALDRLDAVVGAYPSGSTVLLDRHDLAHIFGITVRGVDTRVRTERRYALEYGDDYPPDYRQPTIPLPDVQVGMNSVARRFWTPAVVEEFIDRHGVYDAESGDNVRAGVELRERRRSNKSRDNSPLSD